MSRIISSPDFEPVSPVELKVFRDLEKNLNDKKRKERRAKQKRHAPFNLESKKEKQLKH